MSLGRFGGSSPVIERVSGGGGTAPMGDSLAKLQAYGNIGDLPIGYRNVTVRVFNSANISILNDAATVLTFDSERWDTDGIHSTSANTGRLTCVTPGEYLIFAQILFEANATGVRRLQIRLNGTTFLASDGFIAASEGASYLNTSTHFDLVIGDYLEALGFQTSGAALNITADPNHSPEFGMVRVP